MTGIVWLASYPKSDNIWLRIFLANHRDGGMRAVDINTLRETSYSDTRAALYERASSNTIDELDEVHLHHLRPHVYRFLAGLGDALSFVKTHNAIARLNGIATITPKVTTSAIFVMCDPRDVAVSLAHHFDKSLDDAVPMLSTEDYRLTTHGRNVFYQFGSWRQHIESWIDAPGLNAHVLRYEDLLARPRPAFAALLRYLGQQPERGRPKRAIGFSSFDSLRQQEESHGFVERSREDGRFSVVVLWARGRMSYRLPN